MFVTVKSSCKCERHLQVDKEHNDEEHSTDLEFYNRSHAQPVNPEDKPLLNSV